MIAANLVRAALGRFNSYFQDQTTSIPSEVGFTPDDVEIVPLHINRLLLFAESSPSIPPIPPEPFDEDEIDTAFAHLLRFAAAWPNDRVDAASGLTKADLEVLVAARAEGILPRGIES